MSSLAPVPVVAQAVKNMKEVTAGKCISQDHVLLYPLKWWVLNLSLQIDKIPPGFCKASKRKSGQIGP